MSKKDRKKSEENLTEEKAPETPEATETVKELKFEEKNAGTASSAELAPAADEYSADWPVTDAEEAAKDAPAPDEETEEPEEMKDPIFRELAEPKLPALPKENRARLQMQSPTRLYFYWTVRNNPFQTLNRAFGGNTGSYMLVTRLINRTRGTEEIYRVEPEGNWWFNVEADNEYVAEIGFYAPNRPFIRVMFSNHVRTPRRTPSWRTDYTPSFNVSAYEFAEVLDVAGYRRDAFDVAIAGDDESAANRATDRTYSKLFGNGAEDFGAENGEELRFALLALASGHSLEDLRGEISEGLYRKLKAQIDDLSAEEILRALKENFDILTDEFFEEEEIGDAVFGASLVNFPRRIKKRSVPKTLLPKLSEMDLEELRRFAPGGASGAAVSSTNFR